MHPGSWLRRRPSASLVVSFTSLFVALGGVGYAATQLPRNSVGNSQIQNGAVSNWKLGFGSVGPRKLQDGAVGKDQINPSQVQARVTGECSDGQAVTSVGSRGTVTCIPTAPKQIGASSNPVTVAGGSTPTIISSETLPSGSPFLVLGIAHVTVTGSANGQSVKVSRTLTPGGTGNAQTVSATTHVSDDPESLSIPISVPTAASTSNSTASVACIETHSTGSAPTVSAAATINAIETASNS